MNFEGKSNEIVNAFFDSQDTPPIEYPEFMDMLQCEFDKHLKQAYAQGVKDANEEAYKIIKEAKRKWAPNTTNSEADDWLKSYEKKLGEE